jgi:S-(hydroxymethyl)mycothiol dehydrogenase
VPQHGQGVIDAVRRPETWTQGFYTRDLAGTVVLVGVPTPGMQPQMPLLDFFSHGSALRSLWYGDCQPDRDFPTLVGLYQQGRLPLHTMYEGNVLRSVVVL